MRLTAALHNKEEEGASLMERASSAEAAVSLKHTFKKTIYGIKMNFIYSILRCVANWLLCSNWKIQRLWMRTVSSQK